MDWQGTGTSISQVSAGGRCFASVLSFRMCHVPVSMKPILQIKKLRLKITQDVNAYLPYLQSQAPATL